MGQALVATIGTFDGVHRGHRALLDELSSLARQRGGEAVIVTFDPSPSLVLSPAHSPRQLATSLERMERLRSLGFHHLILLPFTPQLASLSAEDFMTLLRDKYGIRMLLLGYDHRFGRGGRSLGLADYERIAHSLGIEVRRAQSLDADGEPISSSRIRSLLLAGNLEDANALLGYEYRLSGRVVGGLQIGRSLGYPTANIVPDDEYKLIPANGVYAVRIGLESRTGEVASQSMDHFGMLYIGNRPTLDKGLQRTIEVNIFDLHANLYAQQLSLDFVCRVRGEERFTSLEDLQAQIARDEAFVRQFFHL